MKGFKNTSKTIPGHHFASGGIVPKFGGGMPGMRGASAARPMMPRPHVMPQGGMAGMRPMAKLAKGGRMTEGNSLSPPVPYSDVESEHPRRSARPGYAKGGKPKIKTMKKVADQEIAKHVATKPPRGHGVKPRGGLGSFNRAPLCGGGKV